MPLYRFRVSDTAGAVSEVLIEGDSQTDATRRVQRRGLVPVRFLGEGAEGGRAGGGWRLGGGLNVIDFTDRLVPLLEADIPLERALGILGEGSEDSQETQVVNDLRRGLHEGRKLSQLIRDRGQMFPREYASVVEAGEEAGALPQVMGELRRFLNEGREFRAFLISSSLYPLVVLSVSLAMVGVLLGVVVPKFAGVLMSAGRDLPPSTQFLVTLSDLVRGYWWIAPVVLAVVLVLVRQLRHEGKVRRQFDDLMLRLPLMRHLVLLGDLSRMARTMSILMRSGVHLLETVSIGARVLRNTRLRDSIAGLGSGLRQGERLSKAFSGSRLIPPFFVRMLAVGEETGSVETMLERVADRYEEEVRRLVKRLLGLFEPIVIVVLGLCVAGIVVSMFLAIMDIQGEF
jgi:general secretion pathway protein F